MKYLICYVWNSTRRNHAGIAHMCDLLKAKKSNEYRVIKFYQEPIVDFWPKKRLNNLTCDIISSLHNYCTAMKIRRMLHRIKDGDTVYLLEYVHPELDIMRPIIERVKLTGKKIKFYGMAHFTPSFMKKQFDMNAAILKGWSENVDVLLTLGSSLSNYFIELGTAEDKVTTLFHYVDNVFYKPYSKRKTESGTRVIIQGNLQRNYRIIEDVVSMCQDVQFTLLCGRLQLPHFQKYKNVVLLNYISEEKLRDEMNNADISLNIMDDTVGSNVIVTSMAMGLAMVVSDVGSIRDYCDDTNALFCNTVDDFCGAINKLSKDTKLLHKMKSSSLTKSSYFSIDNFQEALDKL